MEEKIKNLSELEIINNKISEINKVLGLLNTKLLNNLNTLRGETIDKKEVNNPKSEPNGLIEKLNCEVSCIENRLGDLELMLIDLAHYI